MTPTGTRTAVVAVSYAVENADRKGRYPIEDDNRTFLRTLSKKSSFGPNISITLCSCMDHCRPYTLGSLFSFFCLGVFSVFSIFDGTRRSKLMTTSRISLDRNNVATRSVSYLLARCTEDRVRRSWYRYYRPRATAGLYVPFMGSYTTRSTRDRSHAAGKDEF